MKLTMKAWLLIFCLASTAHAAADKPWTWKDSDGVARSQAELDAIQVTVGKERLGVRVDDREIEVIKQVV